VYLIFMVTYCLMNTNKDSILLILNSSTDLKIQPSHRLTLNFCPVSVHKKMYLQILIIFFM
jgi:hypothetical protein